MPGLGAAATVAAGSNDLPPGVRMDSASTTAGAKGKPKLDTSDPRVRKLVYSMYRDFLTTYNGEANDIISKKDPAKVSQDSGVGPILESIIIRQRSTQGGESDSTEPLSTDNQPDSETTNGTGADKMPPPPPPPPMMPGRIPAVRLNSEIGQQNKGPPSALASAMMKDKKPFTYTPGGIDLSEIRSPRMAKRIQMNAAAEGVTNTPKPSANNQERAPCALPPAALAAMQPQMAIPVFPQGNLNEVLLNRIHNKQVDYAAPKPSMPAPRPPPPPPAAAPSSPPTVMPQSQPSPPSPKSPQPPSIRTPPSPPPMQSPPPPPPPPAIQTPVSPPVKQAPTSPQARQTPTSPPAIQSPTPTPVARTPPPPPERAATPKSPVPIADSYLEDSRPTSQSSNQEERRSPLDRKSPALEAASTGVGTGCIYIPPIQSPPAPPPPPMPAVSPYRQPSSRPAGQTKAQAVSQNIGSIYIPPIGTVPAAAPDTQSSRVSNGSVDTARMPQSAQFAPPPPQMVPIPQTPQLNKAPIPWMNSYNRLSQQADSPPYVHPGYFMPPWAAPPPPGGARTIPIMMAREPDQTDGSGQFHFDSSRPGSGGSGSTTPTGSRTPSQAATHLGRVIPIQIEREAEVRQKGAKIIPIQIEGRPPRAQTPSTPSTPAAANPMRRVVGPPPYNSPMGMYSNQNVMDAYQRQAAEAGVGVDRMTIRCESPRMEPAQSKAMRVIQQAAENELKRLEQMPQHHRVGISEDDRYVMSLLASQVDEGALVYQTAEPRFMGGHIPSKAFKALQTALPVSSPGAQDYQPPPSYPAAHSVTHHIPIRTVSQSPTPQSQGSELQMSSQPNVPPSEQRVQEPKKYMGSNIPSRSFKILQAMTADDGQSAVGSETASSEQNIADAYDDTLSPCPSTENVPLSPCSSSSFPLSYSSSEGGGSSNFDPYSSQNTWSDMMDQGWDPYTYMWYYWWYYTSCYWAGYDMTGYEYPPGWDPNYPYCPPEFCSDYSGLSDYTTASEQCNLENTNGVSSENSSVAELYKSLSENGGESYYSHDDDADDGSRLPLQNNTLGTTTVPKIVIEGGGGGDSGTEGKWCRDRKSNVDSIKDNNNSNHNDGSSSSIAPSPSTECNQKPGNPIPYKKNDCDSVGEREKMWKAEHENSAECKQLQNGNDNDDDEEREEAQEDSSSSEDEYESCCEDEQKVIERETGPCNKPFVSQNPDHFSGAEQQQQQSRQRKFELHGNYNSELNANDDDDHHHHRHHPGKDTDKRTGAMEEEEDEDEKTDPGADDDNDDDYGGRVAIIEEPETPSSADDSDVAPLVNEHQPTGKSAFYSNGGLSIEEYHSEESSDSAVFDYGLKKNRLSTIDEITESRASSSLFSRNLSSELDCCVNTSNLLKENSRHQQNEAIGESEDSEESSEDELSSVSVIENKSDATRGTESKREDETTSSSEEDSSTDDDDDDDEDDEAAGADADTAVTVRLPLKLCFTKTKSYKDITTVMVGDSEIEKATEAAAFGVEEDSYSKKENEALVVHSTKYNHDNIDKLAVSDDDDDDEPVVSFTLSLSRQPSREDEPQLNDKRKEGHNENQEKNKKAVDDDAPDIDFWAEIKGEDTTSPTQPLEAIQAKSNQESKEDYEEEQQHFETDGGFWGVIARDRSTSDFPRLRQQNGNESNQNSLSLEQNRELWDPHESIDYKWEKDFNFWEKSSRTIETRRFSNFEITEDYESDSGLKPSVKKERAKKYTHHKRHSIPGLPWDRASLPPRPTTQKQSTFSIKTFTTNEQEIEEGNVYDKTDRDKTDKTLSDRQAIDAYQDDTDASSSWWSSWEETAKESGQKLGNNEDHACTTEKVEPGGAFSTTGESEMEGTVESQKEESSDDISREIKLSESECNSIGESTDGDYQSFACRQASGIETRGNGGFSSLERKNAEVKDRKSLNYSCQSDATTVTTDNEDYSSSLEIKSSLLCRGAANQEAEKLIQGSSCVSVSDENSDESSSRSSGTTIGRHDKSEIKKQMLAVISPIAATPDAKPDREDHLKSSVQSTPTAVAAESAPADTSIQIPVSIERNVEIQHLELGERIKLNGKQHQEEHQHQHPTSALAINTTSSSCTCLTGDRIARAENLLWRIERFLHESLSLGSEDDSGVMTDLSRQISDVDTDVDNDLNETEFLLTAAAAAKERRSMGSSNNKESGHIESCNFAETISSTDRTVQTNSTSPAPQVSPQVKKPRPKSDIILESSLTKVETEAVVEENNGVKMRSASERRALRYQRAKTHSRLFQLLQDECGRDEELDEFDYDSDVGLPANETITTDCQINVESTATKSIHVDTSTASHIHSACCSNEMDDDSNQPSCPGMNDSQARRSRLLPLPIKNLLASSLSLDSNSSPSGSSGVLSPTSPVNRDQLLADIINEFHLRNQASTLRAQNQKRISSSFPSKIFKLLQHEFGEEFYQTFDCCGGVGVGEDSLISPCMSTNLGSCVYDSNSHAAGTAVVHECTIHKSDSMKEFEEATSRILTNFMLRNKQKAPSSESPSSTATMSSQLLQDDSKKVNADFLEVPLRKKKANLNRDPRSPKSTKKS